jgi:hypothetical protein
LPHKLVDATRRVDAWLTGRRAAIICVGAALIVYAIQSLAWPLHGGADAGNYLMYWADMWSSRPVFPALMLYRTPLAPLLFGSLLEYGGGRMAEAVMGLAFALSVLSVGAAAYSMRRIWGIALVAALLVWPDYGELFHEVSSDSAFALAFALWVFVVVRTARHPTVLGFTGVGAGVALMVLARPSAQALVLVAAFPFLLPGSLRRRVALTAACAIASVGLIAAWAGVNALRYGDFTVSRTVSAQLPLNRLFEIDKLVSPTNGPKSRALATAVRLHLLTKEPYRSYGITLSEFFSSGSSRMYGDLIPLSDRLWGWSSDYSHLQAVGFETVRAHPLRYFADVMKDSIYEMRLKHPIAAPVRASPGGVGRTASRAQFVTINGRRLPKPSQGEPIPRSNLWWLATTPDGRIWSNPDGSFHFRYRSDAQHARRLFAHVQRLNSELPSRSGSPLAARLFGRLSQVFPAMLFWVIAGLVCFALRRGRGLLVPAFLASLGVAVVFATTLSQAADARYRIPFDPVFLLFAIASMVGASKLGPTADDVMQQSLPSATGEVLHP